MVILYLVIAYLFAGIVFAILFLTRLIQVVDEATVESPWTFKLLIFPGCVVFWPVLLRKYLKVRNTSADD